MPVLQKLANNSMHYKDILEFIHRDMCAFMMKRLSAHHALTFQHTVRVALYSMSIAEGTGMDAAEKTTFLRSVLLHDIGKLHVPSETLSKRTALTAEEWRMQQRHPADGAALLKDWIQAGYVMEDVILYHHENMDGSGYPFGKMEQELSLPVRIVRVADCFDSMAYDRGSKLPKSIDEAMEELYCWSDICFDARIVESFRKQVLEFKK